MIGTFGVKTCIYLNIKLEIAVFFSLIMFFFFFFFDYYFPILSLFIPLTSQHSFVEIDHEIFSTVILSLPLIQEGQLSVSGERMCTVLVNRLED